MCFVQLPIRAVAILLKILVYLIIEPPFGVVQTLPICLCLVHISGQFFTHREVKDLQASCVEQGSLRGDAVAWHLVKRAWLTEDAAGRGKNNGRHHGAFPWPAPG